MTITQGACLLIAQTFVVTLPCVYIVLKVGTRLGWVDSPDDRKVHEKPIVTVGGLGIFVGLFASFMLLFLWSGDAETFRWDNIRFVVTYREYAHLCLLFVASAAIVAVGFWDDMKGISPLAKLGFQTLAAAMFVGLRVTSSPYGFQLLITTESLTIGMFLIFTVWIVLLMNAINLVDGLDGLAGGIVAIASFWLILANRPLQNQFLTWTGAMLLGACLAFLIFNFHPARIFMGDTGSLLLGLWVGAGSIEGDFRKISGLILATPIVLLIIPLLEISSSTFRRLLGGVKIAQADSNHMHHRLLKIGFRHRNIVLFYYGMTFLLGMMGYLLAPERFVNEDPIPRIARSQMMYGVLIVIGGAVLMGYTALLAIEKRFEDAIREITDRYEKGMDIEEDLHELVDDQDQPES